VRLFGTKNNIGKPELTGNIKQLNHLQMNLILSAFLFFLLIPNGNNSVKFNDPLPKNPSLDYKIGQMIKVGFRGLTIDESSHIKRDLEKYHVGAVVLFDFDVPSRTSVRNIESPDQLRGLISDLKNHATAPLLVTIDQEGGRVARLKSVHGYPPSVSAQYLGELDNPDSTRFHAEVTARTLFEAGINTNLAPVIDVNLNPENPIIGGIERSFSHNPAIVSKHAQIFIEAHKNHGVLVTLKHFPGHGSSREDSHLGLVDVTEVWSETELKPYKNLIEQGLADMIMTAHIFNENWDSEYPATLSDKVINGILRSELGFDGVVLSDDMQMDAVRSYFGLETAIKKTIQAGVDILGFANNSIYDEEIVPTVHAIIKKLVEEGSISEERIDESYQRIRKLKMEKLLAE
jgi:beta-N-acetylhexosaminidase